MHLAFVDITRLLDASREGLAGAAELRKLYDTQQRDVAPLLEKTQGSEGKAASPKSFALKQQLEEKLRTHEVEREQVRVDLRAKLLQRIERVVNEVATAEGYDAVVAKNAAILFVKPEIDLTARVLAALDE